LKSITILTADINRGEIAGGKFDLDVTGHYGRPNIFRLWVKERQISPVSNWIDAIPD
jgi:nitrilase